MQQQNGKRNALDCLKASANRERLPDEAVDAAWNEVPFAPSAQDQKLNKSLGVIEIVSFGS